MVLNVEDEILRVIADQLLTLRHEGDALTRALLSAEDPRERTRLLAAHGEVGVAARQLMACAALTKLGRLESGEAS